MKKRVSKIEQKTAPPPSARRAPQTEIDAPVKKAAKRATAAKKKSSRPPRAKPTAERAEGQPSGKESFPVVGIGASAGGLEAFRQLLEHLPVDTGMAFVLVSHLDPTHKSILTELLARSTRLPVREVGDGTQVEPDHVYVMPPNTGMAITEGVLRLRPREEGRAGRHPVDYFLRTLAEDKSHRAIGVILSGTDSDGTLGLEAIKAEGGITFAQDTKSAKYDGMPRSAVASGHVDFILTPKGIAQELARISRHPYVSPVAAATSVEEEQQSTGRNGFRKILTLLHKAKGVDFTDYKANTLNRRIARRMVLNKLESMEDYAKFLRENAAEVEALYQDILISVTNFFRNPETFAVLKEKIFPQVVRQRTPDEPIRIWTLGCSTGEEAYSIAMSFVEFAGDHANHIPVQIFATDLSDRGIEKARAGLYSKDITEDVSPERLRRFFTEADGGYRVSKPIRDMVVFARQNVIADPPFSRLDLISCRNLLIYLEPVLQKQVLPTLHYALKPTGILWLGTSETPGSSSDLFAPEDKKHRFYSKKPASTRWHFQSAHGEAARDRAGSGQQTNYVAEQLRGEHDAQKEADRILLARYSPAGVVINAEMEILQFRGSTGAYLESPAGKATLNLLKMAREGLMLPLRAVVQKAKRDDQTIRKEGVRVSYDGEFRQVNLEVIPIRGLAAHERCFLVLFEAGSAGVSPALSAQREIIDSPDGSLAGETPALPAKDRQVARVQEELAATREYMQSLVEQHEAANEELQSANEEIQSSNEELQSINEELETAKEELESSNEELATLNDELHNRNLELTTLNNDLNNLHVSVNIPILFLGRDLRIRRFTPQAEKVLSLIQTDVGRPVSDIKLKINVPDLEELIVEVIDSVSVREREVQDTQGRWYSMRVRPYKTLDNKIDGAVVVLLDIDALKQSEEKYRLVVEGATGFAFIMLDLEGRVTSWNVGAERLLGYAETEIVGQNFSRFFREEDRAKGLPRRELESAARKEIGPDDNWLMRKDGSLFWASGATSALRDKAGNLRGFTKVVRDITERKQAEEALREAGERFRFMAESMPQKIFTAKPNGDVDYFNRQWTEFTGLSFEQIRDWGWTQFIHPDDVEENVRVWQHSIDTGEEFQFEHRFRRADGEYCWHLSRARAMRDAEGKVLMWIGSNTDIDDVKRAEEEREHLLAREQQARAAADEANRLKDEFLATISHELRTPLTAIMGWAEMLSRGALDEQTAARAVETIARNAHAQNQLIADLLDVSRIISGKLRFEVGAVDLLAVIEAAMDVVRPAAAAKGVELRTMLDRAAGLVPGDADRLQQIVWNLLANAVKYTPRGGHIEARLAREDTHVAIIVRDTGEGIGPESLPYIFDRFRQADGTTTRKHGGLGLGLAIVRHLVEAHGGRVRAESHGADRGATFTVTLPLLRDAGGGMRDEEDSLTHPASRIPYPLSVGLRVLVVDDDGDARELLTLALTQGGAEVKVAATVRAALETLDQWMPDVLVSDIGMPGEDGYALIKQVRARAPERGGLLPALALTGYASADDAQRARTAGFQTHLPKPIALAELIAVVANLAGKV